MTWLKQLFATNLILKIGAFVTTAALFFIVRGENTTSVTSSIPLRVSYPEDMVQLDPSPNRATVTVTGTQNALRTFDPSQLKPIVMLIDESSNDSIVALPINQIQVPAGLRITNIQPEYLTIRMEPKYTKSLPVKPRLYGSPALQYEVSKVKVTPNRLVVSGPKQVLDHLTELQTESISLNALTKTTRKKVAVRLDNPLISLDNPQDVEVRIEVLETHDRKYLNKIAIQPINSSERVRISPSELSVELVGPVKLLEGVRANSLQAIVDLGSWNSNLSEKQVFEPKLLNVPKGLEIESLHPQTVIVDLGVEEPEADAAVVEELPQEGSLRREGSGSHEGIGEKGRGEKEAKQRLGVDAPGEETREKGGRK